MQEKMEILEIFILAMSVKRVAYSHPELVSGSHQNSTNLPDFQYMQNRSISALLVNPGEETMYSSCCRMNAGLQQFLPVLSILSICGIPAQSLLLSSIQQHFLRTSLYSLFGNCSQPFVQFFHVVFFIDRTHPVEDLQQLHP